MKALFVVSAIVGVALAWFLSTTFPASSPDWGSGGKRIALGTGSRSGSVEVASDRAVLDSQVRKVIAGSSSSALDAKLPLSMKIDGQEHSVNWDNGYRTVRAPGGRIHSRGSHVDGALEGVHQTWHANGALHAVEEHRKGEREGLASYYNDGGVLIAEGLYVDGWQEGVWMTWWDNGAQESAGEYIHGEEHGFWQFRLWDGSDAKTSTGFYEHGKRVSD